jgi:ATP-dependent Clp protease ATP-binding subunit ClpB
MVQDKLAVKILDGSVLHGDHVVVDTTKGGSLEFAVASREGGHEL